MPKVFQQIWPMLFNSQVFIFAFLPIVFFGFFSIGKYSHALALFWLAVSSLFFYGWWDVRFLSLLLGSIVFNYGAGYLIGSNFSSARIVLAGSIIANLSLLGYFKYANFFANNLSHFTGNLPSIGQVILPLGISFFTFTQIAFLVDTYQGKVNNNYFVQYLLFVTYFPHLIAGPVLHHKEMMLQFSMQKICRINVANVAVGLSIFVLGLAKKVLIADSLADFSTPIFSAVAAGGQPMLFEAWIGALAYTLQLYFDFSAYSDMAIGMSLMFNIRLPINFNSPYKATSIIDFWRRWHITLSRFLRDYLYIPLGGSRNGRAKRYLNLMITMLLGGLWHGAGWTFVLWGGLHGFYLMVNHAWRNLKRRMDWNDAGKLSTLTAGLLTFVSVVAGWVFFRAENTTVAIDMLSGMAGANGISFSAKFVGTVFDTTLSNQGAHFLGVMPLTNLDSSHAMNTLFIGMLIVFFVPNLQQIFHTYKPSLSSGDQHETFQRGNIAKWCIWQPKPVYAWLIAASFAYMVLSLEKTSEFLYFQF